MKICFFADATSIHTQRWCNHFVNAGHEVHLISFKNLPLAAVHFHFIDAGPIAVGGGNWKVMLQFFKIKKLLKLIKPDIFHALYATSYGITGALCGYHPYVITTLGTDVLVSPNSSKLIRMLLQFSFKRTDWITTMADHMIPAIEQLGVPATKISVVPFGIDPKVFFELKRSESFAEFTITSTRNFEPVYNIPQLLNAVATIKDQITPFQLHLIGAGSLENELRALTKSLAIENEVHFIGKIPQPEIASRLNKSQVFVTVSRSDGNNISLNEAMACGTICIASKIPANEQWIQDQVNGFLVNLDDVADLAAKLLQSYKEYSTLQARFNAINQEIVKTKANWLTNIQKVESHYQLLIKK